MPNVETVFMSTYLDSANLIFSHPGVKIKNDLFLYRIFFFFRTGHFKLTKALSKGTPNQQHPTNV